MTLFKLLAGFISIMLVCVAVCGLIDTILYFEPLKPLFVLISFAIGIPGLVWAYPEIKMFFDKLEKWTQNKESQSQI